MNYTISKSAFKPKALEYLRLVETNKKPLIITHFGKPVAKIIPHSVTATSSAHQLLGSVINYNQPTAPVEVTWEVNQ